MQSVTTNNAIYYHIQLTLLTLTYLLWPTGPARAEKSGAGEDEKLRINFMWPYRRNVSENGDRYERVSDTFTAVRSQDFINALIVDGGIVEGEFNCYNDTIDNGESSLTVQAGDVLGACIFDPADTGNAVRRQLDIIGEVEGDSLLEMNDDGCIFMGDNREIPLSVERSQLSPRSSRRLHLYAKIALFPDQETTTSTYTAVTATVTVASPSDNQGLDSGAVAGLIITVLLLLLLGVAGVVVLLLYLVRKRQNIKEKHTTETVRENSPPPIDNAIYGLDEAEYETTLANKSSNHYEVPATMNSAGHGQQSNSEVVYEATGTTASNMYEYATWGPYEMDVGADVYYSPLDEATISYAKLLEKKQRRGYL